MNQKQEIHLMALFGAGFGILFSLFFFSEITLTLVDFIDEVQVAMTDDLVMFANMVNFLYEIVPQSFQVLGIGAIYVKALETGISPALFVITGVGGKLIGQVLLFYFGAKILARKKHSFAGASHWMHKYHYLVFLIPPFGGALGDLIMVFAGQQKIKLMRILPILLIADVVDQIRWVLWTLATLETVDIVTGN